MKKSSPDHRTLSLNAVYSDLENARYPCVWYLPDKGRHCRWKLAEEDEKLRWTLAYDLTTIIRSRGTGQIESLKMRRVLAQLIEACCCCRHRTNMKLSGRIDLVARAWEDEIWTLWGVERPIEPVKAKLTTPMITPIEFAKHVPEGKTFEDILNDNIQPDEAKNGYVYLFTYEGNIFDGMLKIGYTTQRVASRLASWAECGHGNPSHYKFVDAPHAGRVERLIHFELLRFRYNFWCTIHQHCHIEWFRTKFEESYQKVTLWCHWMRDARPYDRRGCLKDAWKDHIRFLSDNDCSITAESMVLIHRIELGLEPIHEFVDDEALRGISTPLIKEEDEAS